MAGCVEIKVRATTKSSKTDLDWKELDCQVGFMRRGDSTNIAQSRCVRPGLGVTLDNPARLQATQYEIRDRRLPR